MENEHTKNVQLIAHCHDMQRIRMILKDSKGNEYKLYYEWLNDKDFIEFHQKYVGFYLECSFIGDYYRFTKIGKAYDNEFILIKSRGGCKIINETINNCVQCNKQNHTKEESGYSGDSDNNHSFYSYTPINYDKDLKIYECVLCNKYFCDECLHYTEYYNLCCYCYHNTCKYTRHDQFHKNIKTI
jgi:hypothetical protein